MSVLEAAPHFADRCVFGPVEVIENVQLARETYRLRFRSPEMAQRIMPGQFFMLRAPGRDDPLLGRPFALYDVALSPHGEPQDIDMGYLVVGKLTRLLSQCRAGDTLEAWGPLGNGFEAHPVERLLMVAGGIGQTPFLALGRQYLGQQAYGAQGRAGGAAKQVVLCYGARSADYLAGVKDFRRAGIEVRLSTDDGSAGHRGFVTDLLWQALDESNVATRIVCCGPEKMMEAVARIAEERNVPCQVSLETPMACGLGICFSCVARVKQPDGNWDYRRTCVEGPVFDAREIVF